MQGLKLTIIFIAISFSASGQIGGRNAFGFLEVAPSARQAALGGVNVSLTDRDINLFSANPALTGDTLSGMASASYQFYLADIGQAFFSYAHDFGRLGQLTFGVQHFDYGEMPGYDETGIETATLHAGETAIIIGRQHQITHFRLGVNLKTLFSNIAGYRASALAVDLGGVFVHPNQRFTAGLAVKNLGMLLSDYSATNDSSLPFDVQVGVTFKPEHMPLRFSLTGFNLTQRDVTYFNPAVDTEKPGTVDKILSHVNVGTEILIHRNVNILFGYNFLAHQALKLEAGGGGAGVSFGFSAHVKSFEFIFSRNGYVAGNAGYSFTLSTNVNKILKRR